MPLIRRSLCAALVVLGALIALSAACAADIRFDIPGSGSRGPGGVILGPHSVVLEGQIQKGDYEKLRAIYQDKANLFYLGFISTDQLSLASPGGDLLEAMKIGRLVRALKLQTIIPSEGGNPAHFGGVGEHRLRNSKANFMCASACFFVFVAGIRRGLDFPFSASVPLLGIHRPYLSDDDLKAMTGEQAISSASQIRTLVESYLREMNVPPKYTELMFSIPKDQVRLIKPAEFRTDFESPIPELNDVRPASVGATIGGRAVEFRTHEQEDEAH